MDKTPRIEHGDQISAKSLSHVKHDAQERLRRLERFREWYQGKRDGELIPATHIELWRAKLITTDPDLKRKAYPPEIYDCLHLVNSWDNAHPSVFKDSTTQDQKDQLVGLFGQAMSNYRTCEETRFSDKSVAEFKDSTKAYISHYFEIMDKGKLALTQLEDLGKYKPFSHFPFNEIESRFQTTPEALMDKYKDDKETKVFIATSAGEGGKQALFRYHTKWLQELIQSRRADFEVANWPTDPDEFAHKVAQDVVPEDDPFHDVIESLYGYTGGANAIKRYLTIETLVDQIRER